MKKERQTDRQRETQRDGDRETVITPVQTTKYQTDSLARTITLKKKLIEKHTQGPGQIVQYKEHLLNF